MSEGERKQTVEMKLRNKPVAACCRMDWRHTQSEPCLRCERKWGRGNLGKRSKDVHRVTFAQSSRYAASNFLSTISPAVPPLSFAAMLSPSTGPHPRLISLNVAAAECASTPSGHAQPFVN